MDACWIRNALLGKVIEIKACLPARHMVTARGMEVTMLTALGYAVALVVAACIYALKLAFDDD